MKKVISLFFGIALFAAIFVTMSSFSSKAPDNVHFQRMPGARFWASGAVTGSGTWIMEATHTGKAFHCVNTFTFLAGPHAGSVLVVNSNCNTITNLGVWHVVGGSGDFEDAKGNGSLNMGPEIFDGTIDY